MILLGEEDQKNQSQDIGQHVEQRRIVARQAHRKAQLITGGSGQSEEQAGSRGCQNVPVAKDHGSDGEVAIAHEDGGREVR